MTAEQMLGGFAGSLFPIARHLCRLPGRTHQRASWGAIAGRPRLPRALHVALNVG